MTRDWFVNTCFIIITKQSICVTLYSSSSPTTNHEKMTNNEHDYQQENRTQPASQALRKRRLIIVTSNEQNAHNECDKHEATTSQRAWQARSNHHTSTWSRHHVWVWRTWSKHHARVWQTLHKPNQGCEALYSSMCEIMMLIFNMEARTIASLQLMQEAEKSLHTHVQLKASDF